MVKEGIFRSYDIRGIYPEDINEEAAEKIGRAMVKHLKTEVMVVGYDMRKSSPSLFKALTKGITSAGADVVDIGMVPTPVVYFTVSKYGYPAGVVISASHNPPEYNGLKIVGKKAIQLSKDTGIEDIRKIVFSNSAPEAKKPGRIIKKDVHAAYYEHILKFSKPGSRKLKLVIDAGNGMGGEFFEPVLDKLPISYKKMYFKPDGSYPNHPANPAEAKNLKDVITEVKKQKADLGVAFDGDADRAIFIDDKGNIVTPDIYVALMVAGELKNHKDKHVYYDLRFSQVALDALKKAGAIAVRTRVGNPFYKQQLIGRGGTMAAELSGHIMFADGLGLDDGLLPVVKLVSFLSRQDKPLSELIGKYRGRYANPGEINVESKNSAKVVAGLEKDFGSLGRVDKLDGLTVTAKDWWFNVRASNTEPVIRLTLETKPDQKFMEAKKQELLKAIRKYDK